MNWRHFKTFIWLRWRLLVNQSQRAGTFNRILTMIVLIGAIITAVPLFIGSFTLGIYLLPKASPFVLLLLWDGLVCAYLFFWTIGLITELQRSDPLTLSRFLHLPVTLGEAFTINYLSSLFRLSLIVFGPIMLGLALALVYVKGPTMLMVLPLMAAFFLMITALTYQFQGWLAAMMSNPRRRRTVIVVVTTGFVLLCQLPSMLQFYGPWSIQRQKDNAKAQRDRIDATLAEYKKLGEEFRSNQIQLAEYQRRQKLLEARLKEGSSPNPADAGEASRQEFLVKAINTTLPIGWLPIGTMTAAEGTIWPSLLALVGLTTIGAGSLWRAYRTTLRIHQGEPINRTRPAAVASPSSETSATEASTSPPKRGRGRSLLEARIPWASEPVSAVALGSLQGLLRAPETKMMLLTPLIMIPVMGSMVLRGDHTFPEIIRPLLAIGGMIMILFGILQMMGNQFGLDRDGFRVYVLSAIQRRDILLGKNLAAVPFVGVFSAVVLAIVQYIAPMRWDHLLATIPQYISMYLLFCVVANLLSILAPVRIALGTLKPSHPKLTTVLLQFVLFLFVFPLSQSLVLLPLGAEALARFEGWSERLPLYLVLSVIECVVVVAIYAYSLGHLGALFQSREQKILESVMSRGS